MPKGNAAAPTEAPLDCPLCPRLFDFRTANQKAHPDWFNAPVPSFGDTSGRLVIVGLAPGLQGANKTGRPFTGDYAGDLLYSTLAKYAFSIGEFKARRMTGSGSRTRSSPTRSAAFRPRTSQPGRKSSLAGSS
jgi:uracil-DNA glycosylase